MTGPDQLFSGSLPNVHWQRVTLEQLRSLVNVDGLPPVDWLDICGRPSYRYVRQEDPLWGLLHQGVLTTGHLPQTLGFFEPRAAKRLGLPKARVSHRQLVEACHRLQLPPYVPPHASATLPAASGVVAVPSAAAARAAAEAEAERHNRDAVLQFNSAKLASEPATAAAAVAMTADPPGQWLPEAGPAGSSTHALPPPPPQQQPQRGSAPYFLQPPCQSQQLAQPPPPQQQQQYRHQERQPEPGQLPWAGDPAVLAWAPATSPVAPAGSKPTNNKKSKKRRAKQRAQPGSDRAAAGPAGSGAAPSVGASAGPPQLHQQQRQQAGQEEAMEALKLRHARSLGQQGQSAICCAWGKAQEPASVYALAAILPPTSKVVEVGFCQLGPEDLPPEWGFRPGALPPLGASPDALLCHAVPGAPLAPGQLPAPIMAAEPWELGRWAAPTAASVEAAGAQADTAEGPVFELLGLQLCESSNGSGSSHSSAGSTAGGSAGGGTAERVGQQAQHHAQYVYEVVEVKNVCPFGTNQRRAGRGRSAAPYLISDRGPRQEVKPEWVPQLQMHMLCAGTRSALLLSRSATRGMHAFRMWRDDAYLALMLRVLSRIWREHVLTKRPPPPDMFSSWADYHSLLSSTVAVARSAQLVLAVPEYPHPPGGDQRFFLD